MYTNKHEVSATNTINDSPSHYLHKVLIIDIMSCACKIYNIFKKYYSFYCLENIVSFTSINVQNIIFGAFEKHNRLVG